MVPVSRIRLAARHVGLTFWGRQDRLGDLGGVVTGQSSCCCCTALQRRWLGAGWEHDWLGGAGEHRRQRLLIGQGRCDAYGSRERAGFARVYWVGHF